MYGEGSASIHQLLLNLLYCTLHPHAHACTRTHAHTFLIARHFAASWKPTIVSGEQILRKGNSEFLAICAARAVLPLFGGPTTQQRTHRSLLHCANDMVPVQVHFRGYDLRVLTLIVHSHPRLITRGRLCELKSQKVSTEPILELFS